MSNQIDFLLNSINKSISVTPKLAISTTEGLEYLEQREIVYVEANGNYSKLILSNGSVITATRQIKYIEEALNHIVFYRIHNSYIVNCNYVRKYLRKDGVVVVLSPNLNEGLSIPVASARRDDFIRHIGSFR